ncbi:MAG: hypothetical protein M1828_004714 [Chrysothrix sp. TS-e1954]|nr:MAG: hypothetical protein M1828_004714 [Chrysothrix sp. TS-e1954]
MPPYVTRKRSRSPAPKAPEPPSKRRAIGSRPSKGTGTPTAAENQIYLQNGHVTDESSLSSVESDESEPDVIATPSPRRRKDKTTHADPDEESGSGSSGSEDSEQEENAWDDFLATHDESNIAGSAAADDDDSKHIELTLDKVQERSRQSLIADNGKKKGPSAIEKRIRTAVHCVHVQCLMYHNTIRNGWACNRNVQETLVDGLPAGCKTEVERWRQACGISSGNDKTPEPIKSTAQKRKGKTKTPKKSQNHRDWGHRAGESGQGTTEGTTSDPTLKLLKMLSAYWRKRFTVTAPGYRKQGHKEPMRLAEEVKSWQQDKHNATRYGERIESVQSFQELAKSCEGSRDVGAQLFCALLRGLGLEARLVTSLQPLGFGWSKTEEAAPPTKQDKLQETKTTQPKVNGNSSKTKFKQKPSRTPGSTKAEESATSNRSKRSKGAKNAPIDLDDSDSSLTSPPASDSEDSSIVELSPSKPSKQPTKKYDRDLQFPIYWTEVLSPTTQTWIPVDPIVLSVVSSSPESHYVFEPRGAVADRAKQVLAYVIAYSADGTAKDVTVRYLKKHIWPGKTKGARMPPERIAVYNKRGKIVKHEDYDWFKTAMSPYTRDSRLHKPAERLEDVKDLIPVMPTEKSNKAANLPHSSLSWYKTSAEFVLSRHLRREEALLPHAKQVRTFTIGKGDAAVEEPVYRRKDVVACKTAESWHKEGRAVTEDEHQRPLKHVPMRAVTLLRKREIEENERTTGEKMKQPLYSRAQTDWIIPPPIEDGIIPRNAFGNMDVYVPSMVPKGAVHIPLRGTAKICKRLNIEFAEACTGFEFGNKRAVPVLTGVVVAREHEDAVIDAWELDEVAKQKKEDEKRQKLVLGTWRKLWTGLKIVERVKREYGEGASVETHVAKELKKADKASERAATKGANQKRKQDVAKPAPKPEPENELIMNGTGEAVDGEMGGGFLLEDGGTDTKPADDTPEQGGGFIVDTPDDGNSDRLLNGNSKDRKPVSLQALHQEQPISDQSPPTAIKDHSHADADLSDVPSSIDAPAPKPIPKRKTPTSKSAGKKSAKQTPSASVRQSSRVTKPIARPTPNKTRNSARRAVAPVATHQPAQDSPPDSPAVSDSDEDDVDSSSSSELVSDFEKAANAPRKSAGRGRAGKSSSTAKGGRRVGSRYFQ